MSRYTPPPPRKMVRPFDVEMILSVRSAVEGAMARLHERNPAKYHADRPSLIECPFDSSCPFTGSNTR